MERQPRQDRQRGQISRRAAAVLAILAAAVALPAAAVDRRPAKPRRRAAPPAQFDKATTGTFFDDAFATLPGVRPAVAPAAVGPQPAPAETARTAAAAGDVHWSSLVSEETLTDEVKDRRAEIAAAVASPADFKGGGYDRAREAFSSTALAFGVIAAYDREIRWRQDAATARDLFARVGLNCKVGTDQSFAESKARLEDLEALLQGDAPQRQADRDGDVRWSDVATRPALMGRLEAAEEALGAGLASPADFGRAVDRILHDAEMVAVIGEAIGQPDFEYHDDDTYRGHAAAMRDAAVRLREACRKRDYEAARAAAADLKKSCDACHGDYRS